MIFSTKFYAWSHYQICSWNKVIFREARVQALVSHSPFLSKLQKNGLQHNEGVNKERINEIQETGDPRQVWNVRDLAG